MELPDENDGIKDIIRCSCRAEVTDYKAISNKVIAKGELNVDILYTSSGNERDLNTFSFSLPISQIADIDGVDEDCRCDVRFCAVSCEITEHGENGEDAREFSVEAVFCTSVKAYRDCESEVVSDCYSTMYECGFNVKPVSFMQPVKAFKDMCTERREIRIPENISCAKDVWCRAKFSSLAEKDEKIYIMGKLTVCMLAEDSGGEPVYCEQQIDIECGCVEQLLVQELFADIQLNVTRCVWRLEGVSLKIETDIFVEGTLNRLVRKNAVCEITLDEEKGKKPASSSALTIYFADAGESVWNIAKKYNTSVYAVMEENSLEEWSLQKRSMLLIPIIQ